MLNLKENPGHYEKNLIIKRTEEGEEFQLKCSENIFSNIIEEKFPSQPKYKKYTEYQVD